MWDLIWTVPVEFLAGHFKTWGLGFLSEPMAMGAMVGTYLGLPGLLSAIFGQTQSEESFQFRVQLELNGKDYHIFRSGYSPLVERQVNAAIKLGYRPVGNITKEKDLFAGDSWVQAVEKIG